MKTATKLITLMLVGVLALSIFAGCTKKDDKPDAEDFKASGALVDIANKIQDSQEFAMMIEESDAAIIKESYGVDTSRFKEFTAFIPMMISSNSIIIVEANDIADMGEIEAELKARIDTVIKSFEMYLPEPLEMAKEGKVVTKGRYAMMIIAPDVDAAVAIFEEEIK